jgi:hypothetical protein
MALWPWPLDTDGHPPAVAGIVCDSAVVTRRQPLLGLGRLPAATRTVFKFKIISEGNGWQKAMQIRRH